MRETYLDGMSEDETVPFRREREVPAAARPQVRRVAAGAEVIDISGMIRELEATPDARRRQ